MSRALLLLLAACAPSVEATWAPVEDVSGRLEVVATEADGLAKPQDLAFDPERPDTLWIVNRRDDSVTILSGVDGLEPSSEHVIDPYALHFMDQVSSIAFGAPDRFATCQDSRNDYNHGAAPNDFMGPALWSSDPDVFGKSNPDAVRDLTEQFGFPTDLGSHVDMLHQSPLCVGIAWERANVYWVFDGLEGSLVRYDFQEDHGPGYDDHSDGIIARYVVGELLRVDGRVAGLAFDDATGTLYATDPGHGRVVALDTTSGTRGADLGVVEFGTDHHEVDGAVLDTVIDGLGQPTGLELVDDHLVVADTATGHVLVFDLEGGLVADLDTGLGAGRLAGVHATSIDDLWVVDAAGDRVLRVRAL